SSACQRFRWLPGVRLPKKCSPSCDRRHLRYPATSMLLRDRLRALRSSQFIGRKSELARVAAALAGRGEQVLFVHAPGGAGQSALLHELAARQAGACYVDARDLEPRPPVIEAAFAAARGRRPALLLLDTVENLASLDRWLGETFIPSLREGEVLVLAGRN